MQNGSSSQALRGAPKRYWWVPAVLLLCLAPICFDGFGSDNDTYGVLMAGISTWHRHTLMTSRHPGYWVYEAIVYVLSTAGGYLLSNLMSLAVTAVIVWRFWVLAQRLRLTYPALMACCLVVTPVFAIAATSTIDYNWSLLFIVLAAEMILAERLAWAALLAAVAMGIRGSNSVVVAGGHAAMMVYEFHRHRRVTRLVWKLAASAIVAVLLTAPLYLLSYHVVGRDFAAPMIGPAAMWTMKMRVGRFIYKGSYLLAPAAMLVCLIAAYHYPRAGRPWTQYFAEPETARLLWICAGFSLANVILYFEFPLEVSYLIPGLFFFLLLAGATLFRRSMALAIALFVTILSLNFVLPEFARPNVAEKATDASPHFTIVGGTMVQDVEDRHLVIRCRDVDCRYKVGTAPHQ